MELILLGIIVVVGGILIFKLIKKLLFAALTFIVMIFVILAGLGGLIYYDISSLAKKEHFVLQVQLEENTSAQQGFLLPFENQSPSFSELKSIEEEQSEKDYFRVGIEKSSFDELIKKRDIHFESFEVAKLNEYNATLTGEKYLEILYSQNSLENLIDYVFANYSMPQELKEQAKQQARTQVEEEILTQGLGEKDLVFALGFTSLLQDQKAYLDLFKLYKEEKITIEPKTISMKFVSYIPTSFFKETLENQTFVE